VDELLSWTVQVITSSKRVFLLNNYLTNRKSREDTLLRNEVKKFNLEGLPTRLKLRPCVMAATTSNTELPCMAGSYHYQPRAGLTSR
jgi:hypothetical protein